MSTPLRKAVHELHQEWAPLWKHQETPPFRQMRDILQYDNTSFKVKRRQYVLPQNAPTGHGAHADHRETSHYVGKVLERISPELARVYRGGAVNTHLHEDATNMNMRAVHRDGALGGLKSVVHKFGPQK